MCSHCSNHLYHFLSTIVANINKATEGKPEVDILELQLNALEAGPAVRNNGGGHYNHAVSLPIPAITCILYHVIS
jgi:superoxide dismutase